MISEALLCYQPVQTYRKRRGSVASCLFRAEAIELNHITSVDHQYQQRYKTTAGAKRKTKQFDEFNH